MSDMTGKSFKTFKKERREFYKNIVSVESPILNNATVYFRNSGFFHLINETSSTPFKTVERKISEQYMKLKCLEHAPHVLKNCESVSKVRTIRRKKPNGNWTKVKSHELVCEVSPGIKIRVIVEENNLGEFYFASIMPHDRSSKLKSAKGAS